MTFRSDRDARAERRALLAAELARIDEALAAAEPLAERRASLSAEIAELDARDRRVRLPRLSALDVPEPCSERWEDMPGDGRQRWCARCHEHVFDLSGLAEEEAEALLARSACIRFVRRPDGTVATGCAPASDGTSTAARVAIGVLATAAVTGLAFGSLVGSSTMGRATVNQTRSDAQAVRSAVLLYLGQEPGADCPSMDALVAAGTLDRTRRTTDAWDHPFRIACEDGDIVIRSDGPDGLPDTVDDID